jgi:hypothetical protein
MDPRPHEAGPFAPSLEPFLGLTGDRRTAALLTETLLGILGGEGLVCGRIAALSPRARRQSLR